MVIDGGYGTGSMVKTSRGATRSSRNDALESKHQATTIKGQDGLRQGNISDKVKVSARSQQLGGRAGSK